MQTSGIDLTTKTVTEAHRLRANLCFRVKALRACRVNTHDPRVLARLDEKIEAEITRLNLLDAEISVKEEVERA